MFPVFQPESPQAQAIYDLFVVVLLISSAIFAIVSGLVAVAIWRGRKFADMPKQDFGSHRAELYWMIGPVIIVLWIAAISAYLVLTINAVPAVHPAGDDAPEYDLTVTGHQWWWEVRHNDSGITGANEIYIPAGKKVRVRVRSADVIHSFWVPQLARKIDAIPGRNNYVWLEAAEPGVYEGRCSEYCGTQHAWMNFEVYALSEEDFAKWQDNNSPDRKSPPGTDPDALAGERLFFAHTCANCHAIQGTRATASIGPDLTHLASRKDLGGGVIANSAENLRRWLKNPQDVKPGSKMPNFNLNDEQVRQIAAYLESLD